MSVYADPATKPPLEERFYALSSEEFEFFKARNGIEDEEAMKQHIIAVQKSAYKIYGYPCIRFFSFTKLKVSRLPVYQSVLKLHHEHPDAILLDMGCCFGNDLRKAVSDGWPVHKAIASDLQRGFWDFGHQLFKSTPESFPAAFVAGDAFDSNLIAPRAPFNDVPQTPHPGLASLTSLTPLQGRISAIHASSFFHLFSEERQQELAERVATLLSPLPGSIIFGSHIGSREKGYVGSAEGEPRLFCHSPDSWSELWDCKVFGKGTAKVDARLKYVERPDAPNDNPFALLVWSITRQ
ncbi:hypothetical protein FPV67DRAFT_616025 [Lyophyllum atratum]|nr:hypothetical protein FPV67DRAFT_616025 [Lyophyllum atratum]